MSTTTTTSFVAASTPPLLHRSFPFSSRHLRSNLPTGPQFKFKAWSLRVKCKFSGPNQDAESEAEMTKSSLSSTSPSSSSSSSQPSTVSAYKWSAGIGGLGFIETAYLTYLKLTDTEAFCPTAGGGSCGDVLNSDYAAIFGVPLSLIGMVAYGLVSALSLQLSGRKLPFGVSESDGHLILLTSTTSMAAASGYFLYILNTRFSGLSCSYCLLSAFLSFGLFFITLKDFGLQEVQKMFVLQFCVATFVIVTLNSSYSTFSPVYSSTADINLPYVATEITTPSSPFALSLAKHLRSIGAKMYGAFWCSHCVEQKQMFGKEAYKMLDYVECFPDGYRKGTQIAKACADVKIEGFPMWVINGQVLSGEQELSELARVAGFKFDELTQASEGAWPVT